MERSTKNTRKYERSDGQKFDDFLRSIFPPLLRKIKCVFGTCTFPKINCGQVTMIENMFSKFELGSYRLTIIVSRIFK
jgi:hypothetical protein